MLCVGRSCYVWSDDRDKSIEGGELDHLITALKIIGRGRDWGYDTQITVPVHVGVYGSAPLAHRKCAICVNEKSEGAAHKQKHTAGDRCVIDNRKSG